MVSGVRARALRFTREIASCSGYPPAKSASGIAEVGRPWFSISTLLYQVENSGVQLGRSQSGLLYTRLRSPHTPT